MFFKWTAFLILINIGNKFRTHFLLLLQEILRGSLPLFNQWNISTIFFRQNCCCSQFSKIILLNSAYAITPKFSVYTRNLILFVKFKTTSALVSHFPRFFSFRRPALHTKSKTKVHYTSGWCPRRWLCS